MTEPGESDNSEDPLAWLPALVLFTSYRGEWEAYEDALYKHFVRDFIMSSPKFPDRRWALKRHPESKGKACTFWHLISEGHDEESRTPDMRRCERICWPRPLVDEYEKPRVRSWRNDRGRSKRILIAVEDFSYLVVLEDRRTYVMLWTAFHVENSNRRRQLRKEWEKYRHEKQSR